MTQLLRDLPFTEVAPREGRRAVAEYLDGAVPALRDAVLVVASELVTHAVQSTRPPIRIRCTKHGRAIYIFVDHDGPHIPLTGTARRVIEELAASFPIRPAPGRLGFQASV